MYTQSNIMNMTTETQTQPVHYTGRVKWFNSKAGYGFITVCDGEQSGNDIFVHFSSIHIENSQYKYLVQGEYVEFVIVKSDSEAHEFHAVEISGIKGGPLMCQTQRQASLTRPPTTQSSYEVSVSEPDATLPVSEKKPTPRYKNVLMNKVDDGSGFIKVSRAKPSK